MNAEPIVVYNVEKNPLKIQNCKQITTPGHK